jgi:TolA-binding protein
MNAKIKIALYILFAIGAIFCGAKFYSGYKSVGATPPPNPDTAALTEPESAASTPVETAATNAAAIDTNAATTASATNAQTVPASTEPTTPATTSTKPKDELVTAKTGRIAQGNTDWGSLMGYLGGFLGCAVGLGFLISSDVSSYMASKALDVLYNDDGVGLKTPDYEKAEEEWANGNFLVAIQLLRDYQKKNPREVHAQVRIAEIYEKDLNNLLAAALEYEEILKRKLRPDRWGWYAIHLCNLYFKLDKADAAVALLQRLQAEYPEVPAAAKARKRLTDMGVGYEETGAEEDDSSAGQTLPPPSDSNLPPGFRKRK